VDGFKSLKNFSLILRPGLNILAGPNGGGKTNIISFFEFLSYIVKYGSSEAINKLGGVGSVFSKRNDESDEFQRQILVAVTGSVQRGTTAYLNYQYCFKLIASPDFNEIIFSEQEVKLLNRDAPNADFLGEMPVFIIKKTIDGGDSGCLVENYSKDYGVSPALQYFMRENKKTKEQKVIEQFLESFLDGNELSLVPAVSKIFPALKILSEDLCSGQVFNFIPSKIKMPEDTSGGIGIQKDGSGLAATLFAIQKNENNGHKRKKDDRTIIGNRQRESNISIIKPGDILRYVRTANQSIVNVYVDNDKFENLLKIKFTVMENNKQITLPASSMSDGTIKWLSFITSILTSSAVFSIEEPENYLHPLMQGEAVTLIRDFIESRKYASTVLMSTHSETILNHALPEEIIITEYINGATVARHCSNASDISEEIRNTGFGAGYYYISGSFEYE
jgi:predicted ATPase